MLLRASALVLLLFLFVTGGAAQSAPPDRTSIDTNRSDETVALDATRSQTASKPERFRWGAALEQTGVFLAIEHSLNLQNYLDVPHDHFFHRYAESVRAYHFDRWNDGNHIATNYVGHPFSGAIVGFIEIQNDPGARAPQSAGAYWKSRLRATAWAAAYSLQWEIGPVSESSLGNYGIYPFLDDKGRVVNSTGLVDLFITPLGGLGWMAAEDWLDRRFLSGRHGASGMLLCAGLNPARSTANALRFKSPCYRDRR
jgi:hypothetical protein